MVKRYMNEDGTYEMICDYSKTGGIGQISEGLVALRKGLMMAYAIGWEERNLVDVVMAYFASGTTSDTLDEILITPNIYPARAC